MEISDLISIGIIKRSFGNDGFVVVIPEIDFSEQFLELSKVFVVFSDETVLLKTVQSCKITKNNILIKFSNTKNKFDALSLKKAKIMIPKTEFNKLSKNKLYDFHLVGFEVFLENGKKIGKIDYIFSNNANNILAIKNAEREILIPLLDQFIKEIVKSENKIIVKSIKGLLDVN
ncbi:MAG: 16S rRNA processing protein RimM [Candidatus Cloacimonetes bacterium]|nr:16S rRNA processing protein RimM [Candidatus Cloacimonadota bacterium]MBL7108220.1 16S rRNA processing protein RimM [Candidatus Cloacimonadota bacterium]